MLLVLNPEIEKYPDLTAREFLYVYRVLSLMVIFAVSTLMARSESTA